MWTTCGLDSADASDTAAVTHAYSDYCFDYFDYCCLDCHHSDLVAVVAADTFAAVELAAETGCHSSRPSVYCYLQWSGRSVRPESGRRASDRPFARN